MDQTKRMRHAPGEPLAQAVLNPLQTHKIVQPRMNSTDGQTLDAQLASLKAAGAERIFSEKISGAVTDRKALAKAIAALGTGDVLLVTRLDRLARSTRDLLNVLDSISRVGAKFKSLADSWADTTTPHGELMITILAGLATFERHLIKARTDEGRKRAQARGVRFGRPIKLTIKSRKPYRGGKQGSRWRISAGAMGSAIQRFRGSSCG
jgi:DNA invertase Pin-like site-specific DNA recombinase